jgi:NAD(P)-dependent dehydrogenase (short-subunit alcohol dehydrogenase family)
MQLLLKQGRVDLGLTKTIALERTRFGITENTVTLGIIGTDAYYDLPENMRSKIFKRVPLGKEGSPKMWPP